MKFWPDSANFTHIPNIWGLIRPPKSFDVAVVLQFRRSTQEITLQWWIWLPQAGVFRVCWQLKTFEHNHSMSNFGLFFFFLQMSWIFACGLRFNRKSQPCIFFRWFALRFPVKTYAKNSEALFAVCCRTRQAKETYCFPEQWNQRSVL